MSRVAVGQLIAERYRLEAELSRGGQGVMWRASDQLAGGAPMVLRQLEPGPEQQRLRQVVWPGQHGQGQQPVVEAVADDDDCWAAEFSSSVRQSVSPV